MLLVDGNHLASRNRHAKTKRLCTSSGTPSGVVYGFFNGLSWARHTLGVLTSQIVVCWDGGRAAKRKLLYPGYKAGRTSDNPTPEEIAETQSYYSQIDAIICGLPHLGIRQVKVRHVEADDLLSIYASTYEALGRDVYIFTGDHDLRQCVTKKVHIFDPADEKINLAGVLEKSLLSEVTDLVRIKALAGDKSDAIKGVPGIGEVRARQLLPLWDEIFSETPAEKFGKVAKYLIAAREHKDVVLRNFAIIKLPKNWAESFYGEEEVQQAVSQLTFQQQKNTAEFIRFCRSWELTTLIERLDQW